MTAASLTTPYTRGAAPELPEGVVLLNADGTAVTGGGAGTEYTEDVAAGATPTGKMMMARRRDTPVTNEVSAENDVVALIATNKGELRINDADLIAKLPSTLGAKTSANSLSVALASDQTLPAGENHIGQVGGTTARISATFNRPADTTAYTAGDLVANDTTAGSVTPMTFAIGRVSGAGGMIRRCRLRKTGTGVTNASFRLHLYSASPTPSNGDNGAWLTDGAASYVGAIDVTVDKVFSDGAAGNGAPIIGSEINFTALTYYGLLEARAAYTPANGETFDLILEVLQN